jgi:hypothetical protein
MLLFGSSVVPFNCSAAKPSNRTVAATEAETAISHHPRLDEEE